VKHLICT